MKWFLLFLPLFAQYWEDSDAVKAMKEHVTEITLARNEGRAPGSEGEKAVAAYVSERLSSYGVDVLTGPDGDIFGISRPDKGDTLESGNVIGLLEGYDPAFNHRYIVVGARMDNLGTNTLMVDGSPYRQIYTGANGNASGVAMLLELASRAVRNRIIYKRSIIFVGFGASTASFAGAWHFLHQTFAKDKERIDVMIDLDMLGVSANGMQAFTGGNEDLNLLLDKVSASRPPIRPSIPETEPYPSDYQVFYAAEIPSVMFSGGHYPEHNTPRDTQSILDFDFMEREAEYLICFLEAVANAPAGVPSFHNRPSTQGRDDGVVVSWADCDVPPRFLGSPNPSAFMDKWVYVYLKYPEECIRDGIQGRVMVEFTIGSDGNLKDIEVTRGVDELLDAEALKVISASPKWQPGKINGKKVDSRMTVPVEFRLKKRK